MDGGYTNLDDIQSVSAQGVKVFAPVQQARSPDIDRDELLRAMRRLQGASYSISVVYEHRTRISAEVA